MTHERMKLQLVHGVDPTPGEGSYCVLHEWCHALGQQPIQILEVNADPLSVRVFLEFTWNRNILEQFKGLLLSVFMLYPNSQVSF